MEVNILPILISIFVLITGALIGLLFKRLDKINEIDTIGEKIKTLDKYVSELHQQFNTFASTLNDFVSEVKVLVHKIEDHREGHEETQKNTEKQRAQCGAHFKSVQAEIQEIRDRLTKLETKFEHKLTKILEDDSR